MPQINTLLENHPGATCDQGSRTFFRFWPLILALDQKTVSRNFKGRMAATNSAVFTSRGRLPCFVVQLNSLIPEPELLVRFDQIRPSEKVSNSDQKKHIFIGYR
jgi:hypothetical protein